MLIVIFEFGAFLPVIWMDGWTDTLMDGKVKMGDGQEKKVTLRDPSLTLARDLKITRILKGYKRIQGFPQCNTSIHQRGHS